MNSALSASRSEPPTRLHSCMIEKHPNLTEPSMDAVLWRYMDFSKFVDLLDSGSLYFSKVEVMEDPYEAALPRATEEEYRAYFRQPGLLSAEGAAEVTLLNMRIMRTQACISCWHENPHESAAMWRLYAKSDECVAIKTSFRRFQKLLAEIPELVHVAKIQYLDYGTQAFTDGQPSFSAFDAITHKRKSFEHEREVRLILWTHASVNQVLTHGRELDQPGDGHAPFPQSGFAVKLSPAALIEEVYVSPRSPKWLQGLVGRVLQKYGLSIYPIRSQLYDPPLQ